MTRVFPVSDDVKPKRTLGTAGLVCGLLSVFPFGALAGVPAVVLSALALRKEPGARGRSIAGLLLGATGILITGGLALWFAILTGPSRPHGPAVAGEAAVTYNMYSVQGSLEEWAEGNGAYPAAADFNSDSSRFVTFLSRDRVG